MEHHNNNVNENNNMLVNVDSEVTFELGDGASGSGGSPSAGSLPIAAAVDAGIGSRGGSAGGSTQATTSPRGPPLEWSTPVSNPDSYNYNNARRRRHGAGGGGGMDSGYQTDSPLMMNTALAAAAAGTSTSDQQQQEQFQMSMEDLRLQLPSPPPLHHQQQQQQQPPPGTFRPVSPQPVMLSSSAPTMRQLSPHLASGYHLHYQNHHHQYYYPYRPPSVPMADLPEPEEAAAADEAADLEAQQSLLGGGPNSAADREVAYVAASRSGARSLLNQREPLPDLLLETTVVDIRVRSQSVPVMPEDAQQLRLQMRREESVEMVAMRLRHIGDEIDSSRSSVQNRSEVLVFQRLRGYSVSETERQGRSSGDGAGAVGGGSASSYPGDPMSHFMHDRRQQQQQPQRRQSWLGRALYTLSGAGISSEEAEEDGHADADRDDYSRGFDGGEMD
ncbi:hypothetical protein BOX15_Mlig026279g2 [Macrostomum lignano]|uniref:Uncharacterized protein n=1 Tax=Macrostomum lignano TaxID=282301 RepID=A0A267DID4_9PLAT|nr:hypothetical protein BOX15_Mlig026279g1 [Macrostomum lignano]PAA73904.1 hypothetical protein BOX15_Mlig026279g2 [Macrostomum lignano]